MNFGLRSYAYDWRYYLREKTVRRLNRQRAPEHRLHFRKKTSLARDMLEGLQQLLPAGFPSMCSSTVGMPPIASCNGAAGRAGTSFVRSSPIASWVTRSSPHGPKRLRHQRYQRVLLTATDGRQRTYLVRTLQGQLNKLSFEVCVLISKRHHRDKRPKYFLCTDLALSAREILPIYQKRWPIEQPC